MLTARHLSVYFGGFVGPLGGLAVLTLFPALKADFGVGIDLIQLSIPVFMLPFAFFQLFSGTISDSVGRGQVVVGGFTVHATGSIICGLAPDLWTFLAGRLVQGLGFAFVSPVLNALIGDITEGRSTGSAMGLFGSAITLGIAMGPLLAGFLEPIDWRLAFYLFAGLSVSTIFLMTGAFGRGFLSRIDGGGTRTDGERVFRTIARRNVVLLCTAGFLAFFSYIGPQTYVADRFSRVFAPHEIGYILSAPGFVGIFWAPVAGRLVDRVGRLPVGLAGMAAVSVGLLALALALPLWSFIMIFGFIGLGTSTVWASLMTLAVEVVPDMKGTVASIYNASRFFGYALAPPLMLYVYTSQGIDMVYAVGAACAMAGVIALRAMRRTG